MDISGIIVTYTPKLIILVFTISTFVLTLRIYLNLLKFKEAALGLIITKLNESVMAFKLFAVAVLIFSIGRLLDLFNLISQSHGIDNFATVLYLITDIVLIISFYKLVSITNVNLMEI